jgi:hypothetical protein
LEEPPFKYYLKTYYDESKEVFKKIAHSGNQKCVTTLPETESALI